MRLNGFSKPIAGQTASFGINGNDFAGVVATNHGGENSLLFEIKRNSTGKAKFLIDFDSTFEIGLVEPD